MIITCGLQRRHENSLFLREWGTLIHFLVAFPSSSTARRRPPSASSTTKEKAASAGEAVVAAGGSDPPEGSRRGMA